MNNALRDDRYAVLRSLAWRYRNLRGFKGADRHRVFLRLSAEVDALGAAGADLGELHAVLYELLQEHP